MKGSIVFMSLAFAFILPKAGGAQSKVKFFNIQRAAVVTYSAQDLDFDPKLLIREMPRHSSEKIQGQYPNSGQYKISTPSLVLPKPQLGLSFFANPWGVSTPNDNDMAISDSGMIVSVVNTNIYIKDIKTNSVSPNKSLAAFTSPVNGRHEEFDPKVIYDPQHNRFVLVCLVGFVDSTSKIIVGFSQSPDPNGAWNLYTLPGNPLNNTLWTDYPMLSLSKNELFITVNLLTNNSSWQTGFKETLIWQITKTRGYAGTALNSLLHHNISLNGRAIRNLCPVRGGSQLSGPDMFFLSNRNLDAQNDTVFLVHLSDTLGAINQTLTVKPILCNPPYMFPPDGRQALASQSLATNDARHLGAFIENNSIQYVHNCKNPSNNQVSVYYGRIANPYGATPSSTGIIIPNDSMDFAYPNISYFGKGPGDHSALISFNHSSNKVFTGCSAIQSDGQGQLSPILRIQNGTTYVNVLSSNLERWGDYTGSQRRYNKSGEIWMSGYYAYMAPYGPSTYRAHGAWLAQIFRDTTDYSAIVQPSAPSGVAVFPNPTADEITIPLHLKKPTYMKFELYNSEGRLVDVLWNDWVVILENAFHFSIKNMSKGSYTLRVFQDGNFIFSKPILKL
jgi:hypothetical protein